jgi:Protein of unknown function (DUF1552)
MNRHWSRFVGRRPSSAGTSRRLFLGGAAAAVTLPFLETFSRAVSPQAPVRLLYWFAPDGMVMDQLLPASEGPLGALPRLLAPLEALKSEILVLGGLTNDSAAVPVAGDHARGTGSFLTCVTVEHTAAEDIANGISADQVAANALAGQTQFKSLELGTTGGASVGDCDSGYSCAYVRNISWLDADTPNPKLVDPGLVFDRLFAGSDAGLTVEEAAKRKAWRTSVLDTVLEEATELHGRVSTADRLKLDEYLTGVRELEILVNSASSSGCDPGARPESGLDYPALVRAMSDLTVLAFQCDVTRVLTFMLENGGSYRSFDFLGVPEAHHELSHHQGDPTKIEKLAQIGTWEIGEFAYLLERLRQTADVDGTSLLDNTFAVFSSEISDGDWHNHDNLPVVVGGRAGGYIAEPGRFLDTREAPIADLYLAMLESVGVTPGTFGADGTRPLDLS